MERGRDTSFRDNAGYVWLAYLGFLLIDPLVERHRRLWLGTLAVVAVFVAMYFLYVRTRSEAVRLSVAAATFVLGMATLPWNSGAVTFFVYTAAFLPFSIRSVKIVLALLAAECTGALAEAYFLPQHVHLYSSLLSCFLLLVIGISNIFFAQQRRADCKLRLKQEEVEALAAVAERERIARDLHDVLGHTLSLIVLKAELAGRLLDAGTPGAAARARAELADVESTSRTALAEVREAIGGYRARGLSAEMEAARRTLDAAGVSLHTEAAPAQQLAPAEETVLALALREAVTNIVRHARAKSCRVRFVSEGGRHRLVVEDDGEHTAEREGNGLRGMRERVESLGGRLELAREHGTRLLVELPTRRPEPTVS